MEKDSSLYDQLEKRINQIIQNFSFVQYDRTIPPTDKEQDQIRAMIVLSHAEFEDYFELLAQEILDSGFAHWEDKKEANKNIAALFLYNEHQADFYKQSIDTIGHRAKNNFEKIISNNHGIKSENIKKMYTPLGYLMDDIDQSLCNDLDAFGKSRGGVAHTSASRTQEVLDLESQVTTIRNLLDEIKNFDNLVTKQIRKLTV